MKNTIKKTLLVALSLMLLSSTYLVNAFTWYPPSSIEVTAWDAVTSTKWNYIAQSLGYLYDAVTALQNQSQVNICNAANVWMVVDWKTCVYSQNNTNGCIYTYWIKHNYNGDRCYLYNSNAVWLPLNWYYFRSF